MMDQETRRVRRVTLAALDASRDPDPDDQVSKILARISGRYGEDSIREYIRATELKGQTPVEAATRIYGDGMVGQQLDLAMSRIVPAVE